jgi:hypothetical protein
MRLQSTHPPPYEDPPSKKRVGGRIEDRVGKKKGKDTVKKRKKKRRAKQRGRVREGRTKRGEGKKEVKE